MSKQHNAPDLDSPEFDSLVKGAISDIAVPQSRATAAMERLRGRLHTEAIENGVSHAEIDLPLVASSSANKQTNANSGPSDAVHPESIPGAVDSPNVKVVRRRRAVVGSVVAGLAIAASLLVALKLLPPSSDLTRASLISGSRDLVATIGRGEVQWQRSDSLPPQARYQISPRRVQLETVGKTQLDYNPFGGVNQSADIWHLQSADGSRTAYWIEVDSSAAVAELTESLSPLTNSGRWTVAAMQVGPRVFVLVSNGDVADLLHAAQLA